MEPHKWRPARSTDKPALQALLLEREEAWASLADRFMAGTGAWHQDYSVYEDRDQPGRCLACCYLNQHGLAILAVSPDFSGDLHESSLIRLKHKRFQHLFCLMGTSEYMLRLQFALGSETIATTRYYLMNRIPPGAPADSGLTMPDPGQPWPISRGSGLEWHGLTIRRAQPADASSLYELQALYELEEVLVPGHRLNTEMTYRQLELNLASHCIWLAAAGKLMVAKAGTNARSWHYAQIGGVFTLPAWRNRSIGEQLMKAVLQDIFSAGLGACLFVKQANAPALQLYEKLGFNQTGELIISYF